MRKYIMNSYSHNSDNNNAERPRHYDREARRKRRRKRILMRRLRILSAVFLLGLTVTAAVALIDRQPEEVVSVPPVEQAMVSLPSPEPVVSEPEEPEWSITYTENTAQVRGDFPSQYVILLDLASGEVLAQRDPKAVINPASMTKILTLLVSAEHVTDEMMETGTFTMTRAIGDYCFVNKCSNVGYEVDEVIPVKELFYGCILCSGADACLGLAETIFGSHEAIVEAMNAKVAELGLSEKTHFTNCIGLYDPDLHCTVEEMAIILRAALENDFCREVLTTTTYQSLPTDHHPQGQVLSNLFSRRIQYQDTGTVTVSAAKTGYVEESGFCAASYGTTADGREYLCVTGKSTGTQQSIKDHAELYRTYCPEAAGSAAESA